MGNENTKMEKMDNTDREEPQNAMERRLRLLELRQHRDRRQAEQPNFGDSISRRYQHRFQLQTEANKESGDLKDKPWRCLEKKGSWNEKYTELLLDTIRNHNINEKDVENIRILLLGQIKAGKSSFLNTIASIDKGRTSQVTVTGGAGTSMTSKLKVFRPKGRLKNFRLLDTMGVEDTDIGGFNIKDLLYVIKGHVSPNYKFNPTSPIDEESRDFKKHPKNKDKIHCVVFVIDANVVGHENISDASRKKIKALQDELKSQDIPRIVLLTKIDVLCEMIEKDIANCYRSAAMKKAVILATELFNVPEQNIFPIQNYSTEMEMDPKKEILHLLALRQMIFYGTDFLNEKSSKTSDDEDSS